MYTKVDMVAQQTRAMILDKLLRIDPNVTPEGRQGRVNNIWCLHLFCVLTRM